MATREKIVISFCNGGQIFKRCQILMVYDMAVCDVPQTSSKMLQMWDRFKFATLSELVSSLPEIAIRAIDLAEVAESDPGPRSRNSVLTLMHHGARVVHHAIAQFVFGPKLHMPRTVLDGAGAHVADVARALATAVLPSRCTDRIAQVALEVRA